MITKETQNVIIKQTLEQVSESILTSNTVFYRQLRNYVGSAFRQVHGNRDYNAQEILDATYGTDAVRAFTAHYYLQMALKTVDPTYELLTPPPYKANEDGSITIDEA